MLQGVAGGSAQSGAAAAPPAPAPAAGADDALAPAAIAGAAEPAPEEGEAKIAAQIDRDAVASRDQPSALGAGERREGGTLQPRSALPSGAETGAGAPAQPLAIPEAPPANANAARARSFEGQQRDAATAPSRGDRALPHQHAAATRRPLAETIDDLLAAAADRVVATQGETLGLDGAPARIPRHLVLLVTATVAAPDAATLRPAASDAFDLTLDPALVSGSRLLATHVVKLDSGRGHRAIALYDLELTADLDRAAVLGSVRVRTAATAAAGASAGRVTLDQRDGAPARPIDTGDFASHWSGASAELRLATLGAEISSGAPDADAAARLDRELTSAAADPALDARAARGALELRAAVAPPPVRATAAAAAPAKPDG
jgi:hypothetical protein